MEPIKIVIVHQYLGLRRGDRMIIDIALALKEMGMDVEFLCNDRTYKSTKYMTKEQIKTHIYGSFIPNSILGFFKKFINYIKAIYLYLMYYFVVEKKMADLYIISQVPVFVPALKYRNAKVLYYYCKPQESEILKTGIIITLIRGIIGMFEEYTAAKANKLLVNSVYSKKRLFNFWLHLQKKVDIIYPTIVPSLYQKFESAARSTTFGRFEDLNYVFDSSNIVFLVLGRYESATEMEFIMKSFQQMKFYLDKAVFQRCYLVLVNDYKVVRGNVPTTMLWYMQKLSLLSVKLNIMSQIMFVKDANNRIKYKTLVNCDALVHMTQDHFNYRVTQAMAFGRPVLITEHCGSSEMVINGETGYILSNTTCFEELGKCMAKIAISKEVTKKMGFAAKENFDKYYSYERFKEALIANIKKV